MLVPGAANPLLMATSTAVVYPIARSLRFNSPDTAYLSRTFGGAGSTSKFSLSLWVKRSVLGTAQALISYNAVDLVRFNVSDQLEVQFNATVGGQIVTTQAFRDPTAWYHLLVAVDTTQATAANRVKLYVNGVLITTFGTASYPIQNYVMLGFNAALAASIGRSGVASYFDGYMTFVIGVDGAQCIPGNFGFIESGTAAWNPLAPSGFSYGTNGWLLSFSDNSNTTAATLGADTSGNGNNWTPNNFSVAAGVGNDSLTDTPSNYGTDTGAGGEVRGNYCTWNPLIKSSGTILLDGCLTQFNAGADSSVAGTCLLISGKWKWEVTVDNATNTRNIGIVRADKLTVNGTYGFYVGDVTISTLGTFGYSGSTGAVYENAAGSVTAIATGLDTVTTGDVVSVEYDADAGTIAIKKNGTHLTGSPWTLTGFSTNYQPFGVLPGIRADSGQSLTGNFGQRAWANAAASGYKAVCTQNIAAPAISTSGSFNGTANADGPVVYLQGVPTAMTINGNAVTFGTQADALAIGLKLRSSSASYNQSGANTYSVSATGPKFKYARAIAN